MDVPVHTYKGKVWHRGEPGYDKVANQYATSTYGKEHDMRPAAIHQPMCMEDVQWVVRGGNTGDQSHPIAIRTGGHQYSGASSTGGERIQLDLRPTFRNTAAGSPDRSILRENGKTYLITSVSWTLEETIAYLKQNNCFMPTGQCITVCLGGHIQTGGYGMLARSFGLLGDWVREITIVDHTGTKVVVTKDTEPELFYSFLGGSPGNFGVLTHAKIEVQEDKNYEGSKGLWMSFPYRETTYRKLLSILVEKAEDPTFPRGYDMTINLVDREKMIEGYWPGKRQQFFDQLPVGTPDDPDNDLVHKEHYPWIAVYAQWVNLGSQEPGFDRTLFDRIKAADIINVAWHQKEVSAMSEIASWWLFKEPREFPYPYVKRTNTTKSLDLSKNGWLDWFPKRISVAINADTLHLVSQLQVYGGAYSMFQKNAGNGTSYCFRDATVGGTWDIFYSDTRDPADKWQTETDQGLPKYFSKDDRRVLWGSYGDWDMKKVWQFYYDEDTYSKLQAYRRKYDPKGLFTANPFCVEALPN